MYITVHAFFIRNVFFFQLIVLPRHTIFCAIVSMSTPRSICLIFVIYFSIIIFIFITIKGMISLTQTNLSFGRLSKVQPSGVA